jgi:hypothetical protein
MNRIDLAREACRLLEFFVKTFGDPRDCLEGDMLDKANALLIEAKQKGMMS